MKAKQFLDRYGRQVDESEATDARGVLRDGYALRTSMMMKDGMTKQEQIDHALAETKKAMQKKRGVRDAVMLDLINDEIKRAAYDEASKIATNAWRQP